MPIVEPLNGQMILQYLADNEIKYLVDSDGNFCALFASTNERPELRVTFAIEGGGAVYAIRAFIPGSFSSDQERTLLDLTSRWNREHRWPTAVTGANPDTSVVRIWAEAHLPVLSGTHQEMISEFSMVAVRSSHEFFVWLTDQLTLPTAEDLEALFRKVS